MHSLQSPRPSPDSRIPLQSHEPRRAWEELRHDLSELLNASHKRIVSSAAYQKGHDFAEVSSQLNPIIRPNLDMQLTAGISTGWNTTAILLRNAPQIIRSHWPQATLSDCADVLRHNASTVILRKLAKLCVNQMMGARLAISRAGVTQGWTYYKNTLDPNQFVLHSYVDGTRSLDYADLLNAEVPRRFQPHKTALPLGAATKVKDIECFLPVKVGCPITLLQGRLAQMLHWGLDAVVARSLWELDWPELATPAAPCQPS